MYKRTMLTVLLVFPMLSSSAFAMQLSLTLGPKGSKLITNNFSTIMNANCVVQSGSKNKVIVSVLKNKGRVNGKNLTNGQTTLVRVNTNDSINVSAEPGTEVTLSNQGLDQVKAMCSMTA